MHTSWTATSIPATCLMPRAMLPEPGALHPSIQAMQTGNQPHSTAPMLNPMAHSPTYPAHYSRGFPRVFGSVRLKTP